ncbi:MAG: hypothetical protein EXX96DRAFT_623969 [Benjaminiella poitrasii]|nr:MAG: hypothetical protein EXX96DRAFT_623969 [Benjaminiella poitrasii]
MHHTTPNTSLLSLEEFEKKEILTDRTTNIHPLCSAFWPFVNRNQLYDEDDEESIEEEEDEEENNIKDKIVCACGKVLSTGWLCTECRINCSKCNRALAPNEECGRCQNTKLDTTTSN